MNWSSHPLLNIYMCKIQFLLAYRATIYVVGQELKQLIKTPWFSSNPSQVCFIESMVEYLIFNNNLFTHY